MNENKILYKSTNYQCLLAIRKQDTQLYYFFFNMRKKLEYQLLCRIKKKKKTQLKAQQNK